VDLEATIVSKEHNRTTTKRMNSSPFLLEKGNNKLEEA